MQKVIGKETVIKLQQVSHGFATRQLFGDINLSLVRGESLALVGPSGSGKSTLLKIVAGLIDPLQGKALIFDQTWLQMDKQTAFKRRSQFGVLFQRNALFDSLSVYDNIAFPLRERNQLDSQQIDLKVKEGLAAVGLDHAAQLFPDEISGGMQKRLGIARALALDPEIVLYDDPTAGLDPITSKKIIELIVLLQKTRTTTNLTITNDMKRAEQLGGRVAFLIEGQLIVVSSLKEAFEHQDLRVRQFVRGETTGPLVAQT